MTSAFSNKFQLHQQQPVHQSNLEHNHLPKTTLSPGLPPDHHTNETKSTKRKRTATSEMEGNTEHNASSKPKSLLAPIFNFTNPNSSERAQVQTRVLDPDEIIIRFYGNKLNQFSCSFRTKKELDKHLNSEILQTITKAFVNSRNNQLYIITKDKNAADTIKFTDWEHAFIDGIKVVSPNEGNKVYFIAIKNISKHTDIEELKDNIPNCTHIRRIFRDKIPTTTVQAKITDLNTYQDLLTNGYRAGYQIHPTTEWNFQNSNKPTQCLNCYDFGHTGSKCTKSNLKLCSICSSIDHRHDSCPNKIKSNSEFKCSNCEGPHSSLSKDCPAYKSALSDLKARNTYARVTKPIIYPAKSNIASRTTSTPASPNPASLTNPNQQTSELQQLLTKTITNLVDILDFVSDPSVLEKINKALEKITSKLRQLKTQATGNNHSQQPIQLQQHQNHSLQPQTTNQTRTPPAQQQQPIQANLQQPIQSNLQQPIQANLQQPNDDNQTHMKNQHSMI